MAFMAESALRILRGLSPSGQTINGSLRGDRVPEFLEPFQPALRWVAGDDRGVDGADRDADHPIRFQPGLMQRLVDAGLIGAERAAALQDQADPIAAFRPGHGLDRPVGLAKRGSGVA